MNKSDLGVMVFVYTICLFFAFFLKELSPEAQTYPLCLICLLAGLNTLFLLINLYKARRLGFINDLPEIFSDFKASQFVFIVGACLLFCVLTLLVGFYLAVILFLFTVMRYLKVPLGHTVLTIAFIGVVIYGTFSLFLKVPLPLGVLFG